MLYPKIDVQYESKYISISEIDGITLSVYYQESSNSEPINIINDCLIFSLDNTISVRNNILYPVKEGLSKVKIIYEGLSKSIDFIVYDSFFKDNYKLHMIPNIDLINLQGNPILEALFDTLFEFYDILYAYQNDIVGIRNPFDTKSIYLNSLFAEIGFPITDFSKENTTLEKISNKIYRNLLDDISNIISVRGTITAYELFFAALGYDIKVYEYWFDNDSNLVEVDPLDLENSSFKKFDIYGNELDLIYQTYEDPRILIGQNTAYDKNNKSKYIKIIYQKNENLPEEFTLTTDVINNYLITLKPNHVEYLSLMDIISIQDILNTLNDDDINFNLIQGDFEEEEPVMPPFIITGKTLKASGSAQLLTFIHISNGSKLQTLNSAEFQYITENYSFESDGQLLIVSGESFYGVNTFESEGQTLIASSTAEMTFILGRWNPRIWGPQNNKLIYWYNHLTQNNRDNVTDGWVSGKPADFFARDYKATPKSKTYSDQISISERINLLSTIETMTRYDVPGVQYDDDVFRYDAVVFLYDNTFYHKFQNTELKNYYDLLSSENPPIVGETEEEYTSRIKQLVLIAYSFINDGIGLPIEILDELLK